MQERNFISNDGLFSEDWNIYVADFNKRRYRYRNRRINRQRQLKLMRNDFADV